MGSQKPLAGLNILVVEDEYLLADDMSAVAADQGARVDSAGTVSGALALVSAGGIDVAILDVNLRGASSEPVAERLAQYRVPTLVVTGYDREMLSPRLAALPFLGKPFSSGALVDALDELSSRCGEALTARRLPTKPPSLSPLVQAGGSGDVPTWPTARRGGHHGI